MAEATPRTAKKPGPNGAHIIGAGYLATELDKLVGDWTEQVHLPGVPVGRMSFEWTLDGQFLLQRSEIPGPDFPDSFAIIGVAAEATGYTQHYFDSRGVVRIYSMTLDERTWTLLRDQPDFTPLNFSQRFSGTFDAPGTSITAIRSGSATISMSGADALHVVQGHALKSLHGALNGSAGK